MSNSSELFSNTKTCSSFKQCLPLSPDRLPETGCNGFGQAVQVSYIPGSPARFCNTYIAYLCKNQWLIEMHITYILVKFQIGLIWVISFKLV